MPIRKSNKKLFENLSAISIAHLITLGLGLISTIVWTRFLPIELYGQFKLSMGIITFAAVFCLLGAGQMSLMSASKEVFGNFKLILKKKLFANFIGTIIILGAAGYYLFFSDETYDIAIGLFVAANLFPIYNLSDLWTGWLNGISKFTTLALERLTASALALLSIIILYFLNIETLWIAIFILMILISFQNFLILKKISKSNRNTKTDKTILSFGNHLTAAMVFTGILTLDVVLLEYYHNVEEVALYAAAIALPNLLKTIFAIIGQLIAPKIFSSDNPETHWAFFKLKFIYTTLFFAAIGIVGFIFLPSLIPLIFSEKYLVIAEPAKWLWLIMSLTGTFGFLGNALLATKQKIYVYLPNVGFPILLCLLYLLFIELGVNGMILARCIGASLLTLFYVVAFSLYLSSSAQPDEQTK